MRNRIQVGWLILILMMISLTITACVRPYTDPSSNEPTIVPFVPPDFTPIPTRTPDASSETPVPPPAPLPTSTAIAPTAEPVTQTTYIVLAGDTLFKIALDHDVSVDDIANANGIIDIDSLEIGQELIIPAPGTGNTEEPESPEPESGEETGTEPPAPAEVPTISATDTGGVHKVQPGDNLFRIGLQYGCTVEQLSTHNGIANPNRISVGMEIQIPDCN